MSGTGYVEKQECELFEKEPDVWFSLFPGNFAVFYPEDVHAPLAADEGEKLHKIVVKVKL